MNRSNGIDLVYGLWQVINAISDRDLFRSIGPDSNCNVSALNYVVMVILTPGLSNSKMDAHGRHRRLLEESDPGPLQSSTYQYTMHTVA